MVAEIDRTGVPSPARMLKGRTESLMRLAAVAVTLRISLLRRSVSVERENRVLW